MSKIAFICLVIFAYHVKCDLLKEFKLPADAILGPFYAQIVAIGECEDKKRDPELFDKIEKNVVLYKKTRKEERLRGSIDVKETISGKLYKVRVSVFYITNRSHKLTMFDDMDCNHILSATIMTAVGLKSNNDCNMQKGTYTFDNLDVNYIVHLMVSKFQFGRYSFEVEWYSQDGTIECILITAEVISEAIHNKKG